MNIKLILKGFVVGLGKIIPGVSGSMLAYSLGIYENIIEAITNFFSNPKNNSKILINFCFGVFMAIILFSKIILFSLNTYYNETMYLFTGLIIGTIINFRKELIINKKNIGIFLITLIIFYGLTSSIKFTTYIFKGGLIDYFYTAFLGGIDALTSVVPGISGTAIFMLLGSYEYILHVLANPLSFEFLVYGGGLLLGVVITCYIMNYLLKNKREIINSVVFAFMIGSIFLLLLSVYQSINVFMGMLFIVGVVIGYNFES